MEIKVLKTFLDGRDRFEAGEIRQVSDENGAYFCDCGWAEDVSGEVPTGEIKPGKTRLDIRSLKHTLTADVVGEK